ncbi:MAG: hypothetical protein ACI8QC_000889 [Planctomycetota bacterium]|jgi:hypothetical protein
MRRNKWIACCVLTVAALFQNTLTLASGDYRVVIPLAATCSVVALVLLVGAWRSARAGWRLRIIALCLLNGWILFDALGRRLPGAFDF